MSNINPIQNGEAALSVRNKLNQTIVEANKVDGILPGAEDARDAAILAAGEADAAKTAAEAAAGEATTASAAATSAAGEASTARTAAEAAADALSSFGVSGLVALTQAQYDGLTPEPGVLYVITGA